MKKISSRNTFWLKKVFPVVWLAFPILFVAIAARGPAFEQASDRWLFFVAPALPLVIGFYFYWKLIWVLADEVFDGGDFLVVRRGGEEETLPLDKIINVSAPFMSKTPRIILKLAHAGRFGTEIAFTPIAPFTLNPFAKNAVAEDLMVRVDAARRSARR
jgi:hypothetical protein